MKHRQPNDVFWRCVELRLIGPNDPPACIKGTNRAFHLSLAVHSSLGEGIDRDVDLERILAEVEQGDQDPEGCPPKTRLHGGVLDLPRGDGVNH